MNVTSSYINLERLKIFRDYIQNVIPENYSNLNDSPYYMESTPFEVYNKMFVKYRRTKLPLRNIKWDVSAMCLCTNALVPDVDHSWCNYVHAYFHDNPFIKYCPILNYLFHSCYDEIGFNKEQLLLRIDDVLLSRKSKGNVSLITSFLNEDIQTISSDGVADLVKITMEYNELF